MKALTLLLFLVLNSIYAEFVPNSLFDKVEKKYNKFAKNRFVALNNLLEKTKDEPTSKKLEKVNDFLIV